MKPEEDLENQSEITKLLMAVSQVKQMSKLHEAPEEIFLQVDPEGDGPGEWDTLDGATWCQERINHNDVRYVRADRVMQLEAENSTLRGHIEQLREAVEEGLSTYKVPMTARICEAITALTATEPPIGDSGTTLKPDMETETKIDGPCIEGDGCPTEVAVLKREWRRLKADREKLLQLLDSASEVIGRFVSDEGWAQSDMDMMDTIDAEVYRRQRAGQ